MNVLMTAKQLVGEGRFAEAVVALGDSPGHRVADEADVLRVTLFARTGRYSQSRDLANRLLEARHVNASDRSACEYSLGLIDWDEAVIGPPELELASAALEFADDFGRDLSGARAFVEAYIAAGGTAGELDDITLAQLMRHRLRREAVYFDIAVARGVRHDEEDLEYHRQRLAAFRRLRPNPGRQQPGRWYSRASGRPVPVLPSP